jgi:hypothetical protein
MILTNPNVAHKDFSSNIDEMLMNVSGPGGFEFKGK